MLKRSAVFLSICLLTSSLQGLPNIPANLPMPGSAGNNPQPGPAESQKPHQQAPRAPAKAQSVQQPYSSPYQGTYPSAPVILPPAPPDFNVADYPDYANYYINKDKHYYIIFPPDWQKSKSIKGFDIMYEAPYDPENIRSSAYISVITVSTPPTMNINEFLQRNITDLTNHVKGFNVVASSGTNLGGLDAKVIVYNYNDYVSSYTVRQFFLVYNSVAYIITCSASVDAYTHYLPLFDHAVNSFQIFQ